MGLQVRLRHALGERVMEIAGRAVDDPVVVGRSGDADVQVPSINVGPRHAVVFVHEGHWVVQDCSPDHPTYVNGEPLSGPRALYSGDVVVLGNDPNAPTIEVDPDGTTAPHETQPVNDAAAATAMPAGYSGAYARGPAGAVPPPPPPPPVAHGYGQPSRMIATGPRSAYAAPAPYDTVEGPQAHARAPVDADEAAWATAAATGATRRRRPRRQQRTSEAAIALAVVVAVAIVGGVSYLVYNKSQEKAPAPAVKRVEPKPAPAVVEAPSRRVPKSIFTDDGPPGQLPAGTKPPKTGYDRLEDTANLKRPGTSDDPPRAGSADEDAGKQSAPGKGAGKAGAAGKGEDDLDVVISESDPTFRRVENAYYSPELAKALLTFQAYEEEFPGKHAARIAEYREEVLDRIWWDRVENLVEKRQELAKAIKKTEQDIKDETEDAYKQTVLEPQLEQQKSRLASVGEKLSKTMGYALTTPPPIGDEAVMAELRAKRDKSLYEPWKQRVLKHVLEKHGEYPWANER